MRPTTVADHQRTARTAPASADSSRAAQTTHNARKVHFTHAARASAAQVHDAAPRAEARHAGQHRPAVHARASLGTWVDESIVAPAGAARGFAHAVADRLLDGVLPHDDRVVLLKRAGRLGISRFDAHLIIAAVQHRAADERKPPSTQAAMNPHTTPLPASRTTRAGIARLVAVTLLIEAVAVGLVLGLWF
jgi:hypothetical protein